MNDCTTTASSGDVVLVDAFRGDTIKLQVELFGATGGVGVAGWTWAAQVRTADDVLVTEMAVEVLDEAKGVLELSLSSETTAAMEAGDTSFDLEATDVGGDVRTLFAGRMRIRPDFSRTVTP
jgi:hypothetical protein